MSLATAFQHLDGIVSAVVPPRYPSSGFSCCSGFDATGDLEKISGHRACEWRIGAFSSRGDPMGCRRRARILLRVRYELEQFERDGEQELVIEADIEALERAVCLPSNRSTETSTIIAVQEADEEPGTTLITPTGRQTPVARIVSIPFEILHLRT